MMKDVDKFKTLHRTSSSRKARRKNDQGGDWTTSTDKETIENQSNKNIFLRSTFHLKSWIRAQLQFQNVTNLLVVGFALYNFLYTQNLFENFTKFSQLSDLEREVSLPTDVAFRYSFFKRIVQADSFIEGLRRVTGDERTEPPDIFVASSFHRYSLSPQVALAGVFYMIQSLGESIGWPKLHCKTVASPSTIRKDEYLFTQSCSGLRDPLYFYLSSVWAMESLILILIFYLGLRFGKSIFGGIISAALFIILHPQRSNYEWLFPLEEKIGWICVFFQIYTMTKAVFCSIHPPWSCTVKIGVSTAFLIIGFNTDAQWFLISQLLIVSLLHIFGFFSRYVTSLVVFGQLTGWQWASYISLDLSFHHWSFFIYTLASVIFTIFIIEPILDWILGKKAEKWTFLRRIILLIVLQTTLISIRCDLGQLYSLREDSRFPLSASLTDAENDQLTMKMGNDWTIQMKSKFNEFLLKNNLTTEKNTDIWTNYKDKDNEEKMGKTVDTFTTDELQEFLRLCFQSRGKISIVSFITKYFWLIIAGLYAVVISILSLIHNQSSYLLLLDFKKWSNESWRRLESQSGTSFPQSQFQRRLSTKRNSEKEAKSTRFRFRLLASSLFAKLPSFSFPQLFSFSSTSPLSSSSSSFSPFSSFEDKLDETGEGILGDFYDGNFSSFMCYHIGQTLFFLVFCLVLGGRWEILWFPHMCLLLAVLSDFQRISKILKNCPFAYAKQLHWSFVVIVIGILVASARVRSNQMHQRSRGRFEIGNPSVSSSLEVLNWIKENSAKGNSSPSTSSSSSLPSSQSSPSSAGGFVIAGADNLMVMLQLQFQPPFINRLPVHSISTVTHHLTVHSWANENSMSQSKNKDTSFTAGVTKIRHNKRNDTNQKDEEIGQKYKRLHDDDDDDANADDDNDREKMKSSTTSVENDESKEDYVPDTSSESDFDTTTDESDKGKVERLKEKQTSRSMPTPHPLSLSSSSQEIDNDNKNEDEVDYTNGKGDEKFMQTTINGEDYDDNKNDKRAEKTFRIESNLLTPMEMDKVKKIYMVFSRHNSLREFHDALISLNISYFLLTPPMCSNTHQNSRERDLEGFLEDEIIVSRPDTITSAEEIVWNSRKFQGDEESWQWNWNWQQQQQQLISNQQQCNNVPKSCNLIKFWDSISVATRQTEKTDEQMTTIKDKNLGRNVHGNFKFKNNNRYNQKTKGGKMRIIPNRKDIEEEEDEEYTNDIPDVICFRLLNERNILPFTRVFQNSFFTIVSTRAIH